VARLPCVKGLGGGHAGRLLGGGAIVGSIISTVGAVIPAAVGVDIGYGMAAVRTNAAEVKFSGAKDKPDGSSFHSRWLRRLL
jgi:RNA-splicing ligase RtcB